MTNQGIGGVRKAATYHQNRKVIEWAAWTLQMVGTTPPFWEAQYPLSALA